MSAKIFYQEDCLPVMLVVSGLRVVLPAVLLPVTMPAP